MTRKIFKLGLLLFLIGIASFVSRLGLGTTLSKWVGRNYAQADIMTGPPGDPWDPGDDTGESCTDSACCGNR